MILSRFIGGLLLVIGTSIGGGMLALPVANAETGFWGSSFFLLLCWALMTLGAFFILEANYYLPKGKHMVSMAEASLGKYGLLITWLSYLLLLYSLLCAYISGGADLLNSLLSAFSWQLPDPLAALFFTVFFGLIVYGGIQRVDYANRALMFGKLGIYVLLVLCIAPYIQSPNLQTGQLKAISGTYMILITSFGFAIIVPNLREYFNDDIKTLRRVIFIGSLIPLLCYIAWDAVIMGVIPSQGASGLAQLMHDPHTNSALALRLSTLIENTYIQMLFRAFTSLCMLTAFLGVSLCLYSFLADGLKLRSVGGHGLGLFCLTFLPPLIVVLYIPGAYLKALNYAGLFCIILLLLLPALMCFFGRARYTSPYTVPGGRITPLALSALSLLLLLYELFKLLI